MLKTINVWFSDN